MLKEKKNLLKEQVYRAKIRIRSGSQRKHFFKNSLPILDYVFAMIDALAFEADPPYEQIQYMFEKVGAYISQPENIPTGKCKLLKEFACSHFLSS